MLNKVGDNQVLSQCIKGSPYYNAFGDRASLALVLLLAGAFREGSEALHAVAWLVEEGQLVREVQERVVLECSVIF